MELLSTSKVAEVETLQVTLSEMIKANEQKDRECERYKVTLSETIEEN